MGTPKARRNTAPRDGDVEVHDVTSYLAALPADRARALGQVRDAVRRVMPHAQESLQYRMPTYEVAGSAKVAVASRKNHVALYVLDDQAVRRHRSALGRVEVREGCIRYRRAEDLDLAGFEALLHDIVRGG